MKRWMFFVWIGMIVQLINPVTGIRAEETPGYYKLDEVVISATRSETSVYDAPQSVTAYSAQTDQSFRRIVTTHSAPK
ncbi:hypothetical protein [Desulfosarcina variabilis]|uniref:hypothetical protein n=1 Tax=Desulfosarcina variabilis TaxID=2300 RepID=UPI003AFB44AA